MPEKGNGWQAFLEKVDAALYQAKINGRNQVSIANISDDDISRAN